MDAFTPFTLSPSSPSRFSGQSPTQLDEVKKDYFLDSIDKKDGNKEEEVNSGMVVEELMKLTSEFEAVQCEFYCSPQIIVLFYSLAIVHPSFL